MRHTYHVLMPFSRWDKYFTYQRLFQSLGRKVIWHPIHVEEELDKFMLKDHGTDHDPKYGPLSVSVFADGTEPISIGELPAKLPSKKHYCLPKYPKGVIDPAYWKLNRAIEKFRKTPNTPDHRYCFLCDDDWVTKDWFEQVDQHDGDFILTSMHRGDNPPSGDRKHPAGILLACPENMMVGRLGMEQLVVSQNALMDPEFKFREDYCSADGDLIYRMWKNYRSLPGIPRFIWNFCDEAFILFNYFEPGRWNCVNS